MNAAASGKSLVARLNSAVTTEHMEEKVSFTYFVPSVPACFVQELRCYLLIG
jgi:hypothetical protein